nr:hypothetical protein [uncultured Anaerocolumna sp.]
MKDNDFEDTTICFQGYVFQVEKTNKNTYYLCKYEICKEMWYNGCQNKNMNRNCFAVSVAAKAAMLQM